MRKNWQFHERDLKENNQKYEKIRTEYDRLEEKITHLDGQIEGERARNSENQLKRQQLAGQMDVLQGTDPFRGDFPEKPAGTSGDH